MISYKTIAAKSQNEYVIEKSKFIATAMPCEDELAVHDFIKATNKEYRDATHNCFAYIIGPTKEQQRYSDDGEPTGTAGVPMLEVLKKLDLTNVCVIVTRYFGGIKLGSGGLIRAYSHSVSALIDKTPKVIYAPRIPVVVTIEYAYYNATERYLQEGNYEYTTRFTETVEITLFSAAEDIVTIKRDMTNITAGTLDWRENDSLLRRVSI